MKAVITVIGKDMVGLLARVATTCAESNANVLEVTQNVLQDYFAMIMIIDITQMNCDIKNYDSLASFGALKSGEKVGKAEALFARIDAEKMLEEIAQKQEAAAKEEEKAKPKEIEGLAEITFDDFAKVELRVAEITECEPIKKAKKLLKIMVNDGTAEPRQIVSGIAPWYKPEDLVGKKVIIVANLKPAKLCGEMSNGMLLAGDVSDDDVKVVFVDMPAGTKIR